VPVSCLAPEVLAGAAALGYTLEVRAERRFDESKLAGWFVLDELSEELPAWFTISPHADAWHVVVGSLHAWQPAGFADQDDPACEEAREIAAEAAVDQWWGLHRDPAEAWSFRPDHPRFDGQFVPAASASLLLADLRPDTLRDVLRDGMAAIRRDVKVLDELYAESFRAQVEHGPEAR
jgi:hypothetical protein